MKLRIISFLLIFLTCNLIPSWLFAERSRFDVPTDIKEKNVDSFLELLNGPSDLDISEVTTSDDDKWIQYHWDSIPKGKSSKWIRINLKNPSSHKHTFVLGTSRFDFLELYYQNERDEWIKKSSGLKYPNADKEILFGSNSYLSFDLFWETNPFIYLKVSNIEKADYQYSPLPFTLYDYGYFKKFSDKQHFLNFFFWGALLIMTLYNLVLFVQLKTRIYLYYVINNLVILAFVLTQSGLITELFFKNSEHYESALIILGCLALMFYITYCKEFLELKKFHPRWNKTLVIVTALSPLPLIFIYFGLPLVTVGIGALTAVFAYTMIVTASLNAMNQGNRSAKFFLIANIFYYAGTIMSILQLSGVFPTVFLGLTAINYVQIGTLFQLSLFSLTMGYRIIVMRNELNKKRLEQVIMKREEEQKRLKIIEEKNQELEGKVKERTVELEERNQVLVMQSEVLETQKLTIENKNKDIVSSINYARRLQDAILPSEKTLKDLLKDSFVFYKPKDIVSGDFYWAENDGEDVFFAVVDCTGHGVPGAFVSIIGSSGLNRIIKEYKVHTTGRILDRLNLLLEETLRKDGSETIRDGMDLAICKLNYKHKTLEYSGACNPLIWITQNKDAVKELEINNIHFDATEIDDKILVEIKPDRQPIGLFNDDVKPFSTVNLNLNEGDLLYVFSDGITDQFGGKFGKKYKIKQFKQTLLEISNQPIPSQRNLLNMVFNDWKGDLEQIDDVTVIGVRV